MWCGGCEFRVAVAASRAPGVPRAGVATRRGRVLLVGSRIGSYSNELRFERHTGLRNAINTSTRQIKNNEAIVRPPLRLDGRAPLCLWLWPSAVCGLCATPCSARPLSLGFFQEQAAARHWLWSCKIWMAALICWCHFQSIQRGDGALHPQRSALLLRAEPSVPAC